MNTRGNRTSRKAVNELLRERRSVKKSPVIADENTKGFLEVYRNGKWGTGDDFETCGDFDIIFLFIDLPARHGNVGRCRQYNR